MQIIVVDIVDKEDGGCVITLDLDEEAQARLIEIGFIKLIEDSLKD